MWVRTPEAKRPNILICNVVDLYELTPYFGRCLQECDNNATFCTTPEPYSETWIKPRVSLTSLLGKSVLQFSWAMKACVDCLYVLSWLRYSECCVRHVQWPIWSYLMWNWCVSGVPWETSEHSGGPCIPLCAVSDPHRRLSRGSFPAPRNGCERRFQESNVALRTDASWWGRLCKLRCMPATRNPTATSKNIETSALLGNAHRYLPATTWEPHRQRENPRRHEIGVWRPWALL